MSCRVSCECGRCAPEYPYTTLEGFRKSVCSLSTWHLFGWSSRYLLNDKRAKPCDWIVGQSANAPLRVGRDDINRALLWAECEIANAVGYDVVPTWHTDEIRNHHWPCQSRGATGKIVLPNTPIIKIGKEISVVVGEVRRKPSEVGDYSFKLEYRSNAQFPHKFTVKIDVPLGSKPEEIKLYNAPQDRFEPCNDLRRWEITDICVNIDSTGTATITGHPAQLAIPELQASPEPLPAPISEDSDYALNPANLDNYVTALEVRFVSITSMDGVKAHIEERCSCGACGGHGGCGHCQRVRYCIDNASAGIIRPIWHGPCGMVDGYSSIIPCGTYPDKFCVNYLAGRCAKDWTKEISALAAAELACPICTCGQDGLAFWQHDIASDKDYTKSLGVLDSALGTRRGQLYAQKSIDRARSQVVGQI